MLYARLREIGPLPDLFLCPVHVLRNADPHY